MKLFKWLRRPKLEHAAGIEVMEDANVLTMAATSAVGVGRSEVKTRPFTSVIEPRDALLRFARDVLVASGARVRVEDSDLLSAVLADGRQIRYTTSLARARSEEETELLVQGGTALAGLLDECAARSRLVALRLWETGDPLAIAQAAAAPPAPKCGVCCGVCAPAADGATEADNGPQLCELCPLREGRTVLAGFGPITSALEQRRSERQSVELTFHMIGTDRRGRHDEWKRIAFEPATRREMALLSLDSVLRMETNDQLRLDKKTKAALAEATTYGQDLLAPAAYALGTFLRSRGGEDYQRRCRDIRTTYDRLLREGGEDSELIQTAFQRELAKLAETFAVEVDIQLDSIAVIISMIADVELRDASGATLPVQIDLGRAGMVALHCDHCGQALQTGTRCPKGHLICRICVLSTLAAPAGSSGSSGSSDACPICRGLTFTRSDTVSSPPNAGVEIATRSGTLTRTEGLRIDDLDAMTPDTWHLAVTWLLERMGYTCERSELDPRASRFFGQLDGRQFAAVALRLPPGTVIGPVEVQSVAALRAGDPDRKIVLIGTAPASPAAQDAALHLGVTLLEQTELRTLLEQLEAAPSREEAAETQAKEAKAVRAEATRARILAELDRLDDTLSLAVNTRKTGSRSVLLESVESISTATTIATQAFVAWETLATDWSASFGDHEERDGSLLILADLATLDEIGERAGHLTAVTEQALQRIQSTPGTGELGYTAWRKAVLEELLARCDSVRYRVVAITPTAWQNFAEARDTQKLQQAEDATVMASYARGRAQKALGQLQTRARITLSK